MNRKDILKAQHEKKYSEGGFGASTTPRPQDFRRLPVRRGILGKVVLLLIVTSLAVLCWWKLDVIRGYLKSDTSADADNKNTPAAEIRTPAGVRASNGTVAREITVADVKSYLTPSNAEIEQLYTYVVNSPFLKENLQYVDRMKSVDFLYVSTNDTVNAFAGRRVVENDGKKQLAFHTVVFGGAARYARLVGLAAAIEDNGHKDMLKKFVEAMPKSFCGSCSEAECVKFIQDNGLDRALANESIRQKAVSYSSGTIVSVLAHETGHHALGHLLSVAEKRNLEISRNQEREADSFASSIISTSPFGEYIFAGTLFWHYAIATQADAASDTASDHPLSKERFENFVRANAEKASAMGISIN